MHTTLLGLGHEVDAKALPTRHDIDIAVQQTGNRCHGVHITGMDAVGSRGSVDATLGPGKRKEKATSFRSAPKAGSCTACSDTDMSSEDRIPLVRRMSLVHSDMSLVDGLLLPGQQAPK
jgi:hypothetical protein